MEYRIVESDEPIKVTEGVNAMIKEGFKPFGDLVIGSCLGSLGIIIWSYCQPMIKKESWK